MKNLLIVLLIFATSCSTELVSEIENSNSLITDTYQTAETLQQLEIRTFLNSGNYQITSEQENCFNNIDYTEYNETLTFENKQNSLWRCIPEVEAERYIEVHRHGMLTIEQTACLLTETYRYAGNNNLSIRSFNSRLAETLADIQTDCFVNPEQYGQFVVWFYG